MRERMQSIGNQERKIFAVFVALALGLCTLYGYFLREAIQSVVARTQATEEIASLDTQLNDLEFSYIALQNSIDIESAHNRGFIDIEAPIFVSRTPAPTSLSLLNPDGNEL